MLCHHSRYPPINASTLWTQHAKLTAPSHVLPPLIDVKLMPVCVYEERAEDVW